ncbi:FtsX-like permease family protein [Chitinophaga lutea]|uniref:FtsX-like permease family protein n=1 Tax=Chitinophaga lutea TaxID=2488634 RepID=A0A3N4PJJ2_9BACT|nr:ABC transporter permease [Chitinophaga lutea]RPE07985.1 FtsX-like permease family protein [Chitinophaga lutea]
MFKHNLLIIFRNFRRFKGSFFINLAGLSTGLACVLLIYLWVDDELHVDKFHQNDEQVYQVMQNMQLADHIETVDASPFPLAEALKAEMPEVEQTAMCTNPAWLDKFSITADGLTIKAGGIFASPEFFSVFTYPVLQGKMAGSNDVMVSASLARKLYKTENEAMGKPFPWELGRVKGNARIAGIFKDVPANSSMQFELVLSAGFIKEFMPNNLHWGNYNILTFAQLRPGTDVAAFNKKIAGFIRTKRSDSNITLFLKKYSDAYLYGKYENGAAVGGRIAYVRLFSIIAVFILLIACINFMNLSTAKASRRLKEVGIKKALGVSRRSLIWQHMCEALMMTFISLFVALLLAAMLTGPFNRITGKELHLVPGVRLVASLLGITLVTGLLAGSYPALYLSRFNPLTVLKGRLQTSFGEVWTRKGLVVFQFAMSVILIVAVTVVYKQIDFVQTRQLGYDRSNVLYFQRDGKAGENAAAFMARIKQLPGVQDASSMEDIIVGQHSFTEGLDWPGRKKDEIIKFENVTLSFGAMEVLGMQMAEGRMFSTTHPTDSFALILNEAGVKAIGLKDPVGKTVKLWGTERKVIGVVKDFHFESFHKAVEPVFLKIGTTECTNMLVKIAPGREKQAIAGLERLYREFNPGYTFEYRFMDASYQSLYDAEKRVSALSGYFAGLAILISCLGLFGLAAFTAERRWKEIGIRKVLGASVTNIVTMLSGDFIKLVLISIVIACPVAWYAMHTWLSGFAYRIDLQWWMFALAGLAAICIALMSVGVQSVKAALMNPVKTLHAD